MTHKPLIPRWIRDAGESLAAGSKVAAQLAAFEDPKTATTQAVLAEKGSKPRPDLIPADVLLACGHVLALNWAKHGDPRESLGNPDHPNGAREANEAAIFRHVLAWKAGETFDPHTKAHHLVHAIVRMAFMASREMQKAASGLNTSGERTTLPSEDSPCS